MTSESAPPFPVDKVRRSVSASFLWLVAERGFKLLGGAMIGILMARYLGPEDYGRYCAALGLAFFGRDIVGLGLESLVTRDLTHSPNKAGRLIGTYAGMGMIISTLATFGVLAITVSSVEDTSTRLMVLVMVWASLPTSMGCVDLWFLSRTNPRPIVVLRQAVWFIFLIARISFIFLKLPVTAFAWLVLFEALASYCSFWTYFLYKRDFVDRIRMKASTALGWLKEGWPVTVSMIIGMAFYNGQAYWVQRLAGFEQAGYFGAALRLAEQWWMVNGLATSVLLPKLVSMKDRTSDNYKQHLQLYFDLCMLVTVCMALLVSLTGAWIVVPVLGQKYEGSITPLIILFWLGPASFSSNARFQYLLLEGKLWLEVPTRILSSCLALTLNFFLTPKLGAIGACLSLLVADTSTTFLLPWLLSKSTHEIAAMQAKAFLFPFRLGMLTKRLSEVARNGLKNAFR